jgi:hypothetical protein
MMPTQPSRGVAGPHRSGHGNQAPSAQRTIDNTASDALITLSAIAHPVSPPDAIGLIGEEVNAARVCNIGEILRI